MNRNSRNDEKDNDQSVRGLRKITYWEKYGVKRFPYRGSRRYSPCVYQSEDGGIVISNDVFGLTIRQFERMYTACVEKRKTHEQYILNLRYPDKTSDEYLEYLHDRTDFKTEYLCRNGNDLKDIYIYEHIVNTAGTEVDMRERQQLFIIKDMITNTIDSGITNISSGSLAEGLDLPGSDIDIMSVINDVDVIQNVRTIKHQLQCTTLVMETGNDNPGFARLRLLAGGNNSNKLITPESFDSTGQGLYLSASKFVRNLKLIFQYLQFSLHGPCLSDKGQNVDFAYCLRSKYLPHSAKLWASRYRQQWPSNYTIDKITKYGCLLVPIGPRDMSDSSLLWRLSFSVAEKQLVHSFNFTQLLCYCILKLTLKHAVNTNKHVEGLLCSYFLKTTLFWVSEEVDIDTFQLPKLLVCFSHCLDKLKLWVKNCYCPNYFIPEHNMFLGKVNSDNNTILLNVLDKITCDGIDGLTKYLFPNNNGSCRFLRTSSELSFIKLDILFYRIFNVSSTTSISQCLKALTFIESLIKSKRSTFIIDVCKHHYAAISQFSAQLHPKPALTTEIMYNIHKRYHRFLQDGIKTDAVSGWLLYASFYYVTGQFDVTLRLTNYVLSRCSPSMLLVGCSHYSGQNLNNYRSHVHPAMTLIDKMRIATVSYVQYLQNSSLIPLELHEVNDNEMFIPPTVMSHSLRFLCYNHLGDISNRQKALRDLYFTVKCQKFMLSDTLSYSLTLLGVCYEISGDKDAAYKYYDEALHCDKFICPTAEARKSKLLEI